MQDNGLLWEQTFDRRALLGKAAVAGGVLAAGGLLTSRALAGSPRTPASHAFFDAVDAITEQEGFRKTIFKGFDGDVDAAFAPITAPTPSSSTASGPRQGRQGLVDLLGGLHGGLLTLQNEGLSARHQRRRQAMQDPPDGPLDARETRDEQAVLHPADAGDVRDGRQQEGAAATCRKARTSTSSPTASCSSGRRRSARAHGQNRFGLPAGETGLIHRFLQGFLVPRSPALLTRHTRARRRSRLGLHAAAVAVHAPAVAHLHFMQDPLLSRGGAARLGSRRADEARRSTSVPTTSSSFPSPAGPKGRAYMPVLAGLAIPKTAPNPAGAKALIRHLVKLARRRALSLVGLLPRRRRAALEAGLGRACAPRPERSSTQQRPKDAVRRCSRSVSAPRAATSTSVYRDTFTRIVLNKEDIRRSSTSRASCRT